MGTRFHMVAGFRNGCLPLLFAEEREMSPDWKQQPKSVKIIALDEERCALYCKFLRRDINGFHCILFDRKLSHNQENVYRTGDCRE